MRKITLVEHLTLTELEECYRTANDGVGRSQWQIIWLIAQGRRTAEIAEVTGYSEVWIRTLARRYNAQGEAGLGDHRHHNPGHPGALTKQQEQDLRQAVQTARDRGEHWNGVRVAQWMSERLGRRVYKQRGYEWLAKHKQTLQVPRPTHKEADEQDQVWFKKRSRQP